MDHGSTMLTSHGPWAMATSGMLFWLSLGRLTGVGIEHNARALITCMVLGILPPALAPSSTSFRYYNNIVKALSFSVLQSLSGHV